MAPVAVETKTENPATLKLVAEDAEAFPELTSKGYTVVPGVISKEKAQHYVDEMYKWLESFGMGFKGDDRSTWRIANVPEFDKGGLYHRYGVSHEQFAWDIRSEPGVIDAFAKLWGTDELGVSYDSVNISLPISSELGIAATKPWPHVDQSPTRCFKHCVQGIVNLYPNGPLDGGLMVLEGSTSLFEEYFRTHEHLMPEEGWPTVNWWMHEAAHLDWFYARGCTWKKVEAGPGDLILWDSRTIHYGDVARGTEPRVATYVCYKPVKDMRPEMLQVKRECFDKYWGTTHDPLDFLVVNAETRGWEIEGQRTEPRARPVLSLRTQKLAGLVPY
ncbi:hypothetical protein CspeluHIS016_0802670 [Cutaneotrichosporon spelunceum]|uniref:Phytanoyl-CoA dioxygenase n=1 Tax=Cutaneotrichosporon spelunceum TaxID=1672016 RepID=A0AAD3YDZ7_9TREE|nr:hypothetical protein CspeluHIS016_0802670 [Cutaneotrichosporon spelunceum]